MENLLCDEVWLSVSGPVTPDNYSHRHPNLERHVDSFYTTKEDCEQAFNICIQKESSYMPLPGYVELLPSHTLVFARFKAIQWLIKSRDRLNLSFETVFNAANYFDRFISMNQCHRWENWMVELLSVACLSVASKFSEISTPSLLEIEMEDLDHSFQSTTIMRMEIILLKALGWRLGSTTSYSYLELLPWKIDHLTTAPLPKEIKTRVTEFLLRAVLDFKMLEYRPSIVAISALWCSIKELITPSDITSLFHEDQKDDLFKCHNIMEAGLVHPLSNLMTCGLSNNYPSSPVSVLLTERIYIHDCHVDLLFTKMPAGSNINLELSKKRKRD